MSFRANATRALFWTVINQFGVQLINFAVILILTRILSPKEIGLMAVIGIIVNVSNILINSGLSQSILRNPKPKEADYSALFYFNIIVSLLVYTVIFFLAPIIARFYGSEILVSIIRIYSLTIIFNALSIVQIVRLSINMNFRTQALISIPSTLFSSSIGIILALKGYGVWSLVWTPIAYSILSALIYWRNTSWKPDWKIDLNIIKPHWKFGKKLMFAGLIDAVLVNFNSALIGKKFGIYQAGLFYRADSIKQFPLANLFLILNKIAYPLLAPIQDDRTKLFNVFKKILQLLAFITFPLLIFSAIIAEPLFRFMFTEKWIPSVKYFQLLCISGLLYPIHSLNLTILNIKGYSTRFFKLQVIKTAVLISVILVSINWGIIGLLYGLIIESIVAFFVNTYFMNELTDYGTKEQLKDIFPPLILSLILGLVAFMVDNKLTSQNYNDVIRILVSGFISFSVYFFLSFLFFKSLVTEIKKLITTEI